MTNRVTKIMKIGDDLRNHALEYRTCQELECVRDLCKEISENCFINTEDNIKFVESVSNILRNSLRPLMNQFENDIESLIRTVEMIYPDYIELNGINCDQIFKYKYTIQEIQNIKNTYRTIVPAFGTIKNIDVLSSPILNVSETNKISCCYKSIYCSIGPLCPALYSKNVVINMISFIEEDLTCSIDFDKYNEAFSVSRLVKPGELVKIFLSLSMISSKEIIDEELKGELIITSKSYKQLSLPVILNLNLLPNDILLTCSEYEIAYIDGNYRLIANKITSDSAIHFNIKNYYSSNFPECSITLSNLAENECKTPPKVSISKKQGEILLTIPSADKVCRLSCIFEIGYSMKHSIKLLIDTIIIPFEYNFEVYDFTEQKYKSDSINIYSHNNKTIKKFPLYFRISCPLLIKSQPGEFLMNLPNQMSCVREGISNRFVLDKEITDFKLTIDHSATKIYPSPSTKYFVQIQIGGIVKKITMNFEGNIKLFTNGSFTRLVKQFPTYMYQKDKKEFIKVEDHDCYDVDNTPPIATVFNAYIKPMSDVKIQYNIENNRIVLLPYYKFEYLHINRSGQFYKDNSSFSGGYVTIFGINPQSRPEDWFPAFNIYPREKLDKWDLLQLNSKNKEIAENQYNEIFENNLSDSLPMYDFKTFIRLFFKVDVILNIQKIVEQFPQYIRDTINDHSNYIFPPKFEKYNIIRSHNFVKIIYEIFIDSFDCISSNGFYIVPQNENEKTKSMMEKAFDEFHTILNINISEKHRNRKYYLEKDINRIQLIPFPSQDTYTQCYLIEENSIDNPKPNEDKQEIYRFNTQDSTMSSSLDYFEVELPVIEIPRNPSIESLVKFYNTCQNATRILPLHIRNLKISNRPMNTAENYFYELLRIYQSHTSKDRSFISIPVNSFIESFRQLIARLRKSEIKFIILPQELKTDLDFSNQDFIEMPLPDQIMMPPIKWEFSRQINQQFFNSKMEYFSQNRNNMIPNLNIEPEFPEILSNDNEESERNNVTFKKDTIEMINNIEMAKAAHQQLFDEMGQEEEDINDDDNGEKVVNEEEHDKNEKTRVVSGKESTKTIPSNKFDEIKPTMSEIDGINRAIQRMDAFNVLQTEIFNNIEQEENLIPRELLSPNKDSFPVRDLIEKSLYLASLFIKSASDKMVPFNNIAANILIDCSSYIGNQSKFFNMMVVCAMTYALNAIEIPYSVALTSDKNFQCVIKSFEEPHSVQVLQRILDCVLIKRYRTKIASSLSYALKYMRYPDKSRNHHAIFSLTDGLDENLLLTKSFAETLFNQKENSFGFIFIKSSQLEGNNLKIVNSVWNRFEIETKTNGAKSIIKIISMFAETSQDSYQKLSDVFSSCLKRSLDQHPDSSLTHNIPEFPESIPQLELEQMNEIQSLINERFEIKKVFINHEKLPIIGNSIDRLDSSVYRGKLYKLCVSKSAVPNFSQQFILNKRFIPQEKLHSIFRPNKASQTVLSSTGTEYDITSLVLNIINPVPDPLIYLEEKGGLIRNYGITVVIDSSFSCFNEFSGSHSLQTLRALLSSLASLSLPCFDLIVATDGQPKVLCSEIETTRALKDNSPLWNSILSSLSTPCQSSDLGSAIHAAFDLRRMRSTEYDSFLFVLTDGLFQSNESKRVLKYVNMCVQCGINTFGIGIGIYPAGIKDIFSQAVFAPNPMNLIKALGSFFGDDLTDLMEDVNAISYQVPDNDSLKNIFNRLIDSEKSPTFVDLKRYLDNKPTDIDAFDEFINKEQNIKNARNEFINPEGANTEMYVKDMLKGQKILIVMLWTYEMNIKDENPLINPHNISNNPDNKECVATCLTHYGIEYEIVHSYKDAINELTRQTRPGFCDYYCVWVLNGPPYPILPPNGNEENIGAHLVGQFVDCLIVFWNNGGSVVLWNDGSGLCYQTNLFLEKVRFQEKQGLVPTKLRLDDSQEREHAGKKILYGDDTGLLNNHSTFNRKNPKTETFVRKSLSNNLGKIFEGVTITYAKNEREIYPFTAFSRDSEGGISTLFYPMVSLDGPGNIIIDCGYTKLFMNMETDGTARYVQNIAAWTGNVELIIRMGRGIRPCDWRPKAVNFRMNEGIRWNGFKKRSFDIVYMVDSTGSMGNYIQAAKNQCISISEEIKRKLSLYDFQYGGILYRDPVDKAEDQNTVFNLSNDVEELRNNISGVAATGGGDCPEDWVGAYRHAVSTIRWRNGNRLLVHIADAPAHCAKFCGETNHEEESGKLEPLIQLCSEMNIKVVGFCIGESPVNSFKVCSSTYPRTNGNFYDWRMFSSGDTNLESYFKDCIVDAAICAAPK